VTGTARSPVLGLILKRLARGLLAGVVLMSLVACGLHVANSGQTPPTPAAPGTTRIASLNAHYIILGQATGDWSVGDWDRRKGAMDAAVKAIAPDIIAFQEMESFARGDDGSVNLARDYLLAQNPGYAAGASGDWRTFPSTQPIFYRTDTFRLLDQGWFFFSDTPDVIYSRTFNGSYPAFASWVQLAPRDGGPPLRVVNVHFEYNSRSNRLKSADLVAARIKPWIDGGEAVVLAGDLNARTGAATQDILAAAGLSFAPVAGATYHFNRGINLFSAIDHIGTTANISPRGAAVVVRQKFGGAWPSDHYPLYLDVVLP
jgi:endonuclease/exonuclease/phosphatase family metal-dependent hydrolase